MGSAVACGILLSVFEGVGVLVNRVFSGPPTCAYVTFVVDSNWILDIFLSCSDLAITSAASVLRVWIILVIIEPDSESVRIGPE